MAWWNIAIALCATATLVVGGPILGCGQARAGSEPTSPAQAPAFRVLDQGGLSGINQQVEQVIRSADAWQRFYRAHAPEGTPPAVDFAAEQVVAVVLPRNTGGFVVSLDQVEERADRVVVTYTEQRPSPDAIVIQVLTQPHVFAAMPKTEKPVVFEHRVVTATTP